MSSRMRELKKEEFGEFIKLIEQREPEIQTLLTTANELVDAAFYSPSPCMVPFTNHTHNTNPLTTPDAFSGPDLDALLSHSYQLAGECPRPNSIYHQCHLWQSVRFDESEGTHELPTWFPRLQQSPGPPRRYQILPFYYSERWQLAVFDVVENMLVCYDTRWTSGSSEPMYLVSRTCTHVSN